MVYRYARCAFLCVSLSVMAINEVRAQAAPGDSSASDAAQAAANAEIAQRLLTAGQPKKCEKAGPDGGIVVCGGRAASEAERTAAKLREELLTMANARWPGAVSPARIKLATLPKGAKLLGDNGTFVAGFAIPARSSPATRWPRLTSRTKSPSATRSRSRSWPTSKA